MYTFKDTMNESKRVEIYRSMIDVIKSSTEENLRFEDIIKTLFNERVSIFSLAELVIVYGTIISLKKVDERIRFYDDDKASKVIAIQLSIDVIEKEVDNYDVRVVSDSIIEYLYEKDVNTLKENVRKRYNILTMFKKK